MGNVFSTGASIKDESLQPEGLLESSRGSERSEDLRSRTIDHQHPGGVTGQRILPLRAPFGVHRFVRMCSGGLRSAPTTGYYLAALQVAAPAANRAGEINLHLENSESLNLPEYGSLEKVLGGITGLMNFSYQFPSFSTQLVERGYAADVTIHRLDTSTARYLSLPTPSSRRSVKNGAVLPFLPGCGRRAPCPSLRHRRP